VPDAALKDVLIFDPLDRNWINAGLTVSQTRAGHGVTSSGGKIYVYGGMVSGQFEAVEYLGRKRTKREDSRPGLFFKNHQVFSGFMGLGNRGGNRSCYKQSLS
jgi:hypothetical protein